MSRMTFFASAAFVMACSDDPAAPSPPAPPPTTASVHLRGTTTGADVDANGYTVTLNGNTAIFRLVPNGVRTLGGLAPGNHTITVGDIAPNCRANETSFRVSLEAGDQPFVDIQVSCRALGALYVSVVTTGVERDTSGYLVTVADSTRADIAVADAPINGSVLVPRLAPGLHAVVLRNLATNCSVTNATDTREIDVVSGNTVSFAFFVTCEATTDVVYSESVSPSNSEIHAVRSNGTVPRRLTSHPGLDDDPVWSPDGSRIAFTSDRGGSVGIHLMDDAGGNVTRLTPAAAASYRPAWSPDGSRIAFVSDRDGNPELYVMNADGSDQRRLTTDRAADRDPAWSPDGTRIAFASDRDGDSDIYVMNADGAGVARLTTNDYWDGQPAWSPDGSAIAFALKLCDIPGISATCFPSIAVMQATGAARAIIGNGDDPTWSPDGRRVAATGYSCDFYYWYYYTSPCTVTGIRIFTPSAADAFGFPDIWDPVLTRGKHANPSWRR